MNVAVFLAEYFLTRNFSPLQTESLFVKYGLVPAFIYHDITSYNLMGMLTIITSMFLHADLIHIAGNMLFLFVFGPRVESAIGHLKYLVFYLSSGVFGALVHTFVAINSQYPEYLIPTIGASAAISGVLGAYIVLYPGSSIIALIGYFIIPARALWFIGLWFLIQLAYVFLGISSDVAYWAHIGGFVFGLVCGMIARLFVKNEVL